MIDPIELARELPVDVPSHAHREEVRTALLARADAIAMPAQRRWLRGAVVGALAAAAAVAIVVARREPARPHAHGTVAARAGAIYTAASPSPDETVVLHDGTIDVSVDPLGPGDRFRVLVGASEIEVRGTAFAVTAAADRLVAVRVVRGRVEVRPAHGTTAVLGVGDSWTAPVIAAPTPATPSPPVVVTPPSPPPAHVAVEPHAAAVAKTRAPEAIAYDAGWAALRASDFHAAAAAFARTVALAPDGAIAGDARYWHAVALAREPRPTEAIAAFRELLDEHAGAPHHGESSAMLGWLLVDAHQLDEARGRFHAAESDPSASVRDSARAGLASLDR